MSANQFFSILNDDTVITARGTDSVSFLQGQLTNDVALLEDQGVQLTGYCNAKGRLYATFTLIKNSADIDLIVPADIAAIVHKRLSMFVMRAKTKLSLDGDARLVGLANPPPELVGDSAAIAVNQSVKLSHPSAVNVSATLIRLSDLHSQFSRYVLLTNLSDLEVWTSYFSTVMQEQPFANWRAAEVGAGIVRVGLELTEMFVPQMLNLEVLGAVNFKKGCYPGQEVVARSQYLGKMKRRTFLYSANGNCDTFKLGADVIDAATSNVEGQVVGIASFESAGDAGQSKLLIETSTDVFAASQAGTTSLKAGNMTLSALAQPYELPVHESLKRVL
jgi:tRNA-modifying protein YgfZ